LRSNRIVRGGEVHRNSGMHRCTVVDHMQHQKQCLAHDEWHKQHGALLHQPSCSPGLGLGDLW
jgi:hypothetical protein